MCKKKKNNNNINLYEENVLITQQSTVANKFNNFFTNIGPNLSKLIPNNNINFLKFMPPALKNSFLFYPTTNSELSEEILALSEKTSSDLPVKLIKLAAMPISNNLSQIFIQSFSMGFTQNSSK